MGISYGNLGANTSIEINGAREGVAMVGADNGVGIGSVAAAWKASLTTSSSETSTGMSVIA
jgi:hypothetical protein